MVKYSSRSRMLLPHYVRNKKVENINVFNSKTPNIYFESDWNKICIKKEHLID